MIDWLETVRAAHDAWHEQEPHPFDEGSQEAVLAELVHLLLERDNTADAATLLANVRYWAQNDATQMTDDELRLRIRFDARDEKRASDARVAIERGRAAQEETRTSIREVKRQLRDDDTMSEKKRARLKRHLKALKASRDNAAPAMSSFEREAARRGLETT